MEKNKDLSKKDNKEKPKREISSWEKIEKAKTDLGYRPDPKKEPTEEIPPSKEERGQNKKEEQ